MRTAGNFGHFVTHGISQETRLLSMLGMESHNKMKEEQRPLLLKTLIHLPLELWLLHVLLLLSILLTDDSERMRQNRTVLSRRLVLWGSDGGNILNNRQNS